MRIGYPVCSRCGGSGTVPDPSKPGVLFLLRCPMCKGISSDPIKGIDDMDDTSSANDREVGGSHYQVPIQPWDFIISNNIPFLEGCIIKYLVRHRKKNGLQDLEKAQHYLEKLIEVEKARVSNSKESGGES